MRKSGIFFFLLLTAAALFGQNTSWRSKVAPEILGALDKGDRSDLIVVFQEKADLSGVASIHGKSRKAQYVYDRLWATAQSAQNNAWKLLRQHNGKGNSLFIVNALAVSDADVELTRSLAGLPEVRYIAYDPWIFFPGPAEYSANASTDRNSLEWGVERVHAPEVWSLGYSGQGITVGGADTGYEWTHPALKPHYRGWNNVDSTADHTYNWHDAIHTYSPLNLDSLGNPNGANPCGFDSPQPCDDHFHGTHTMGTMTGDDGLGNQIGVAPGAKWVGCRNMERGWGRPSSYIECFQWFLAPTDLGGQNPDPAKSPDVINNSWYCDYVEGCTDLTINELLHEAVINLKSSGVMVVVSNGNFGPGCATTYGPPAYFEESFSVGATNIVDTLAKFSSRGPVITDGSNRLKPNISAPGVNVRSSVLNGGYGNASGTSMAGPHVVGVVALVLSARPDLAGEVELLEDILEQTAHPLFDTIGCGDVAATALPNNSFGYGLIDALAAVQAALAHSPVSNASQSALAAAVSPNPAQNQVYFNLDNLSGNTSIEIFDLSGRVIYTHSWQAYGNETVKASLGNSPAGIYYWQVKSGDNLLSGKLVKE